MYRFYHFNRIAAKVMNRAVRLAGTMGQAEVTTEHVLIELVSVREYSHRLCFTPEQMQHYLAQHRGTGTVCELSPQDFSGELVATVQRCYAAVRKTATGPCADTSVPGRPGAVDYPEQTCGIRITGQENIQETTGTVTGQILWEQLQEKTTYAARMLREMQSANTDKFFYRASAVEPRTGPTVKNRSLEKYGKNLTQLARQNQLDPCIGRETEVQRMIQILCRRQKNNPCLLGEPGVGKTAVVEGLARLIARDSVPEPLLNKQIISLDISSVVAGTKYRGDFEERLRGILEEAGQNRSIILFIDELHTVVGAGAAEGAVDAANIFKPVLARGGLQVIGATTTVEYRRHIEKDAALERRFQQVRVEEPDREKTLDILKGLRHCYEQFHGVRIQDEALEAAVDYSVRYIHDRFLPDKAVDLLDEAAASRVTEQKNSTVAEIGAQQVITTVARWSGMPLEELTRPEKQRLLQLEDNLSREVRGQKRATKAVAAAVQRFRMGFAENGRPNCSFLLYGPTGVGKSLLAKVLAQQLFGSEKLLFRFDMSEYSQPHTVSRLIGAPPGYVGFEQAGLLTGTVHSHPYCIVLFDELEKAHPEVLRLLLQLLEEGEQTDSDGTRVDFRHTVVMATSNLGSGQAGFGSQAVGFRSEKAGHTDGLTGLSIQMQHFLSPELLNRFDEVIPFERLEQSVLEEIAERMLDQLQQNLQQKQITLQVTPAGKKALVARCCQPEYGARPLRRGIQTYVETPLCALLLQEEGLPPYTAVVDEKEGQPSVMLTRALCEV